MWSIASELSIFYRNNLPTHLSRQAVGQCSVAWGAAERQGTGKDGKSYQQMYKELGLRMLAEHATLPGGGVGLGCFI